MLFQQLYKFARAFLLRLKQPHVLNGDYRLIGEGLDQLDLLVGERAHGSTLQEDDADCSSLPLKRDAEDCAKVPKACDFMEGVFWIGENIRNLNRFAL